MLEIGNQCPYFEGINQNAELISSSNFIGKKWIIFFYPKANTPACTAEACDFKNNFEVLQKQGFQLLGISADSIQKQKKFHEKYKFPYDLIADENHTIIEKFGVWGRKKFMGKEYDGILRTTFILNEQGIITNIIQKVKTKEATQQILKQ